MSVHLRDRWTSKPPRLSQVSHPCRCTGCFHDLQTNNFSQLCMQILLRSLPSNVLCTLHLVSFELVITHNRVLNKINPCLSKMLLVKNPLSTGWLYVSNDYLHQESSHVSLLQFVSHLQEFFWQVFCIDSNSIS